MQNEPILKFTKITVSPFSLKTKASSLKPTLQKNEPKQSHFIGFYASEIDFRVAKMVSMIAPAMIR